MFATSDKKNIYPCLSWVKTGCAKQKPDKVGLDKEELRKIIEETQEKIAEKEILPSEEEDDGEKSENEENEMAAAVVKAKKVAKESFDKKVGAKRKIQDDGDDDEEDVLTKYGLDDYDNENYGNEFMNGIGSLTPFASNEDDPYITLHEEDSDEEDFVLQPTDNLLALGRVTADASVLDVHIYNGDQSDLFVHHDYILPTLPLVLEWMDYDAADGEKGNFVAMGTMEPDITIWDLDVIDCLEPMAVLEGTKAKKKKKKMKKKETVTGGHSDAVLDLSWNSKVRNVLASASADKTICLWDLSEGKVVSTLKHHSQQVQCVSWHPVETQLLLSGSFDENVAVVDCRSPDDSIKMWKVKGEVERAIWNHFSPFQCLASTDQGMLYCLDTRKDKPLYELSAHDKACTGLSLSSQIPGLLLTTSADKLLKVWDIVEDKPSMVLSRNLNLDILHCVEGNPDHPFVFAIGGNTDFKVWDIRESAAVRKHFLGRMPAPLAAECENDDGDLAAESEAMANLNVDDEEAEREMEEMMAGDRGPVRKGVNGGGQSKKKKKKKKKKPQEDSAS